MIRPASFPCTLDHGAFNMASIATDILNLTSVVFGPYASQILADHGACVIKVASPTGDSTRSTGPAMETRLSAVFLGINRNKRSVVLDLKQASARESGDDLHRHPHAGWQND